MVKIYEIISMLSGVICLTFSVAIADVNVIQTDQPQVIRKKILAPQNSGLSNAGQARSIAEIETDQSGTTPGLVMGPARVSSNQLKKATYKVYDPSGKIDPFKPLLMDAHAKIKRALKYVDKKREPLTALEKIELSQLRLTGIVRSTSGNRAIVQDASDQGYIIENNTIIGTHGGKVVDILPDRLVIEEEMEDIYGKIHVRTREMRLLIINWRN